MSCEHFDPASPGSYGTGRALVWIVFPSEGDAQRIEYDSAANRVRFVGDAHLRMLKGSTVTDTAEASLITYDTALSRARHPDQIIRAKA